MKKKWFIIVSIVSIIIIATYGFIQYYNNKIEQEYYKTEQEMREVINWEQMPEFIQAVKKAETNKQILDLKQYPFLSDKGFVVAGIDYENCVWIGKKGYITDELFYCEDNKTNFNREANSIKLQKQLSEHWFWCKYYM